MQAVVVAMALGVAAAAPVEVTADLRREYLAGDKLLVPITLANDSEEAATVPDLGSRPWLVEFVLQPADGNLQRRRTAAPETDSNRVLSLAPRTRRNTLLEVPSGGALPKGEYTLQVSVNLGEETVALDPQPVRLVSPKPVGGALGLASRDLWETLWVHDAQEGFDLYLHQLDADRHDRQRGHWHLGHLDTEVRPTLTVARKADAGNRVVVWARDARSLVLQDLAGNRFAGSPTEVVAPWPKIEMASAPMLDGRGRVSVPLWVPSPQGASGEIRLLAFNDRGRPVYRRVGRFDAKPTVTSGVDDAGNTHIAVSHGSVVDLYSVRADPAPQVELPVAGRRVFSATAGRAVADVQFVVLARSGEQAGGMALQVATRTDAGFGGAFVSLQGTRLGSLPAVPSAPGARLVQVVPGGWEQPGFVVESGGVLTFVQPSGQTRLAGVKAGSGRWTVIRDGDEAPALLRLVSEGPVGTQALSLTPPG